MSAVAWSRCHLLCHWLHLQDHLPSTDDRRSWRTRVRHDHSAVTGESGAVTRICERALLLPVKVRPPHWPPRLDPVSPPRRRAVSWRRGLRSRARRCKRPSSGLRRRIRRAGCGTHRCGSATHRPALTGHARRVRTGSEPQVATISSAERSDSAGERTTPAGLLAAPRECPIRRWPAEEKRDGLGG